MDNYCVYMHVNKENHKKYIGLTHLKVENRWRNGLGYYSQPKFYNAIKKYGWDNFEHFIMCDELTLKEACDLESYLIKKFNSFYDGYNSTYGGEGNKGNSVWKGKKHKEESKLKARESHKNHFTPINQYSLDGKFIKTFECLSDVKRELNIKDSRNLKRACENKNSAYHGYMWKYYDSDNSNLNYSYKSKRKILIKYKGKERNLKYISKDTGISMSTLRNRYLAGYTGEKLFSKDLIKIKKEETRKRNEEKRIAKLEKAKINRINAVKEKLSKKVLQYDLNGNFIKEYDSVISAQKELNLNHISDACSGKRNKCGNFIWKYK